MWVSIQVKGMVARGGGLHVSPGNAAIALGSIRLHQAGRGLEPKTTDAWWTAANGLGHWKITRLVRRPVVGRRDELTMVELVLGSRVNHVASIIQSDRFTIGLRINDVPSKKALTVSGADWSEKLSARLIWIGRWVVTKKHLSNFTSTLRSADDCIGRHQQRFALRRAGCYPGGVLCRQRVSRSVSRTNRRIAFDVWWTFSVARTKVLFMLTPHLSGRHRGRTKKKRKPASVSHCRLLPSNVVDRQ